jgi:hypothetical protein
MNTAAVVKEYFPGRPVSAAQVRMCSQASDEQQLDGSTELGDKHSVILIR